MPAEATISALRLWAGTSGEVFPASTKLDNEVRRTRSRLAVASSSTEIRDLARHFVYGLAPAIGWLAAGGEVFRKTELHNLSDVVYDCFRIVARQMKLVKLYAPLTEVEGPWRMAEREIWRVFEGGEAINPVALATHAPHARPAQSTPPLRPPTAAFRFGGRLAIGTV